VTEKRDSQPMAGLSGPVGPAALTPPLSLITGPAGSPVEYVVGGQQLTGAARETAAQLLADDATVIRCGNAPALGYWRARRDGGPPLTGTRRSAVATYAAWTPHVTTAYSTTLQPAEPKSACTKLLICESSWGSATLTRGCVPPSSWAY
jgi:hypothetical protein